jgi:hypothetical protein
MILGRWEIWSHARGSKKKSQLVGDLIFVSFFLGGEIVRWGGFFFGGFLFLKKLLIWVRFVAMNGMRRVVSNGQHHFGQKFGHLPQVPKKISTCG